MKNNINNVDVVSTVILVQRLNQPLKNKNNNVIAIVNNIIGWDKKLLLKYDVKEVG
ncbi:hypothetical protein [Shewanella sp. 30m-9]